MSTPITHWLRAFFALQTQAMASRGFVETAAGDDVARWPRTSGDDVVTIAAVIDPVLRAQPLRFGGHGIARRWRAVADELESGAIADGEAPYRGNRSFWNTLPAICVYLHSVEAPLPSPQVWDALLAQLADPRGLRNAGPRGDGPFKHFDNVTTYDELFNQQAKYLRELRGSDALEPEPGMRGGNRPIPRTTNGDVVLLADYWTKRLDDAKEVVGHDGIATLWQAAVADVNALARPGDPTATYPKNNGFWRALQATAIQIAVADEAPSRWDLAVDAIKDSVRELPETVKHSVQAAEHLVGELAHGVGKVANEAGKGLFAGLGLPIVAGAAGLLGLYLLTRSHHDDRTEA